MKVERITVRLLGCLSLEYGQRTVVQFATRKIGALLAYLAFYPDRIHPREHLVDRFWPDMEPAAARHNFRQTLYALRRLLEPLGVPSGSVLISDKIFVRVHPDVFHSDVAAFQEALGRAERAKDPVERLRRFSEAVESYSGDLLPGWYEEWIQPERDRLAAAHRDALRHLAAIWEAMGNAKAAEERAQQLFDVDPMDEEIALMLMRLKDADGRVEEALHLYARLESALARELGIQPAHPLMSLAREIQARRSLSINTPKKAAIPALSLSLATDCALPTLPVPLTRFFGREAELEQLCGQLGSSEGRLLTLTGPGGSGKTRLALEVSHQLNHRFSGRVWFLSLAEWNAPDRIEDAFAQILRLHPVNEGSAREQIARFLGDSPALLTLDNFEHLVELGAESVRRLLETIPGLSCLVTSRECLRIPGEQEIALAPLPIPSGMERPVELLACPSVALFQNRAQAIRPGFAVEIHNAEAVAALCVQLEGIPLAIELAAVRIGVFTPAQMLAQMKDRFALLTDHRRGVSARHRTLRATIDWSFETLTPALKRVFASLSVFRGGWTVEGARKVVGEEASTEAIERLRECSLIQMEETGEDFRFRMLETLREYGLAKLSGDEKETLSKRLADYLIVTAETACEHYLLTGQAIWLERMERDIDNFRAALDWMEADPSRVASLRRLLIKMPYLYHFSGRWTEYRSRLETAAALLSDLPETYVQITEWMGQAALKQADFARAQELLEHSLEIHRTLNVPVNVVRCLLQLAEVALITDRYIQAHALCQEAKEFGLAHGTEESEISPALKFGEIALHQGDARAAEHYLKQAIHYAYLDSYAGAPGNVMVEQGVLALLQGDYASACVCCEKARLLFAKIGHRANTAWAESKLGLALLFLGRVDEADRLFNAALETFRQMGSRRHIVYLLHDRAVAAGCQGQTALAWTYLKEALTLARQIRHIRGTALVLGRLGRMMLQDGNVTAARAMLVESLTLRQQIGDRRMIAEGLEGIAALALADSDAALAAQKLGAAQALRERIGAPLPPFEQAVIDRMIDLITAFLGRKRLAQELAHGISEVFDLFSCDSLPH